MYRRSVDGQTLDFDHCGYVYQGSFVMFDKQTESEWLHVTAECVMGPLQGKSLDMVATRLITWNEWKSLHPQTTVMTTTRLWDASLAEKTDFANESSRPKLGLNVVVEQHSKLYPYVVLEPRQAINDTFQETPLVAVYVPKAACAVAWDRRVDGKVLTFEAAAVNLQPTAGSAADELFLKDTQTGSVWDALRGNALDGPLQGQRLSPLVAIPIRTSRYGGLYPDGEVYTDRKPE